MATKFNLIGVQKFEMGATGADGAMGPSLTPYTDIELGSMTFDFAVPDSTNIEVEDSDVPFAIIAGTRVNTIVFNLLGLKMADLPEFLGGTFTAGTGGSKDKYDAAVSTPNIIRSIAITSQNNDGDSVVMNFPRMQVVASPSGSPTKTSAMGVAVTLTVLQPATDAGVKLAPYFVEGNVVN